MQGLRTRRRKFCVKFYDFTSGVCVGGGGGVVVKWTTVLPNRAKSVLLPFGCFQEGIMDGRFT